MLTATDTHEFQCIVGDVFCLSQHLHFYLNKQQESDIQIQWQCKVFNQVFKYSSVQALKGGFAGKDILVLDVYLNEKGPHDKIKLLNIFKHDHILANSGPKTAEYQMFSIVLMPTNFYNAFCCWCVWHFITRS